MSDTIQHRLFEAGVEEFGRQIGSGPNKDFDKWRESSLLRFCVEQAVRTGIPVAVCWWDSILQINPDGSWYKVADVGGCALGANENVYTQIQAREGSFYLAHGSPGSDLTGSDLKTTNRSLVVFELRGGGILNGEGFFGRLGDFIPSFENGFTTQAGMTPNTLLGLGIGVVVIVGAIILLK